MRVLLVGEAPELDAVRDLLAAREDIGEVAFDEAEGLDLARRYGFDVAALFAGGNCAIDVVRLTRAMRGASVPVPILAVLDWSRDGVGPKLEVFAAGADDVASPMMRLDEIEARLAALARRGRGHPSPRIEVGPVSIDLAARAVRVSGTLVHMTGKELAVLEALALHKGQVLSKGRLMDRLYDGLDDPQEKIIDVYVCKIRRKLEAAGAVGVLQTLWGQGYRLAEPAAAGAAAAVGRAAPGDRGPSVTDRVLRLLEGGPKDFEMIRRALVAERNTLRGAIHKLIQAGQVRNAGGGRPGQAIYALARRAAA